MIMKRIKRLLYKSEAARMIIYKGQNVAVSAFRKKLKKAFGNKQ